MNLKNRLNPELCDAMDADPDRTIAKVLAPAIKAERGNLAATARSLNIDPGTLRNWQARHPRLKQAFVDARVKALSEDA
jgi:hypothetical protein